jgi:alanine dehydrogenase
MFIVGIPIELKPNETRVSLIPDDVAKLTNSGIKVYIQNNAGINALHTNQDYLNVGAEICNSIEEIYSKANLIVKVKEPQEEEYKYINYKHTVITFFHFASNRPLLDHMVNNEVTCYAYETIKVFNSDDVGYYPILAEMSKIAGEISMMDAIKFMFTDNIYDYNTQIAILGVGNAGLSALNIAIESGFNNICLLDKDYQKIEKIKNDNSNIINIYEMTDENVNLLVKKSKIIIGCIYNTSIGGPTEKLITNDMLNSMQKGSIIMDIAIDQGGITEQSIPTTVTNKLINYNGIYISCIPNIPSYVPEKASKLLSNSIIKYVLSICNKSTGDYPELDEGFGLNVYKKNFYI